MPVHEVTVLYTIDGEDAPGWPVTRRVQVDADSVLRFSLNSAGVFIPATLATPVQLFALRTLDADIQVKLGGGPTDGFTLGAGGFLILFSGEIDESQDDNVTVASQTTTQVECVSA